jgi:hypothetical protein
VVQILIASFLLLEKRMRQYRMYYNKILRSENDVGGGNVDEFNKKFDESHDAQ